MEEALNFVTPTKDPSQRAFSDEKQLVLHRKKNDMVLSLTKTNQISSDQTPTPTRFIRNCEAIGLFQDLQNVNPFDETFKRATEAVKKGEGLRVSDISTLGRPAGEDLHTPHIDFTGTQILNNGNDVEEYEVVRTEADTSLKSIGLQPIQPVESYVVRKEVQDVRLFVKMPDGTLVQIPTISGDFRINNTNVPNKDFILPSQTVNNVSLKAQVVNPKLERTKVGVDSNSVKQKLKAALKSKSSIEVRKDILQSSAFPKKSSSTPEVRNEKRVSSTTSVEKQKILERNRIAAMKCREKQKKRIADLRDQYEKVCKSNEALTSEVSFLRKEVLRLKGLLIACCNQQMPAISAAPTTQLVPDIPVSKTLSSNLAAESGSGNSEMPGTNVGLNLGVNGRSARENLRLDIEGATRVTVMDLDSPLVRKDEILSSVAPPTTPNERLISFPELDRAGDIEVSEEKLTTVIQLNPNVLAKPSSTFS